MAKARTKIGELLVQRGWLTRTRLLAALTEQHSSDLRLGSLLVESGDVPVDQLATALSEQLGIGAVDSAWFRRVD